MGQSSFYLVPPRTALLRHYATSTAMGMEITEEQKESAKQGEKGYSIVQVICSAILLGIGIQYLPQSVEDATTRGICGGETGLDCNDLPEEDGLVNPCPNGAANWMWVAGWCLLVTNLLSLLAKFSKWMAEKDGKVTCGEKFGLGLLSFASFCMMVVDFAMLIWGSVVVLGAWAEWNVTPALGYDVEGSCHATPMVAAFAILVVKWLMFFAPIIAMLLMCVCGCALAPFACCAAMCCKKEEAAASA